MINYPELDAWEDLVSNPSFLGSADDIISLYSQLTHTNKIFKTFVKQIEVVDKKDKKSNASQPLVKDVASDAADCSLYI